MTSRLAKFFAREKAEWYTTPLGLKDDLLAGTAVALAQVPEAVAFALVVGINPLNGLFATFFVGLIAAIFGGRPGMISGASGSVAVVQVALKRDYGEQELYFAVILMGIYQMFIGFSGITKYAKILPWPVMIGFVNGLAIVIGISQLGSFEDVDGDYVTGTQALYTVILCFVGFAVTMLMPYLTTFVPSALVAIIVTTFIEQVGSMGTKTVGDMGKMGGSFPPISLPDMEYTGASFFRCLMSGVIYGSVGLVESVMTLQVLDDLTETEGSQSREAFAQGLGNFVAGWFGTMGGSPMIGQSVINTSSGGTRRLSGTWASVLLLVIILAASSVIEMVPTGGLAGVMFSIVFKTFDWSSIPKILTRKVPVATDGFVIVLVTVTTVVVNLAAAVGIGIAYTALAFAWEMRSQISFEDHLETDSWGNTVKVYSVKGRLMFSSAHVFMEHFRHTSEDPADVIIDLRNAIIHDYSGAEVIDHLAAKYAGHDRRLHVRNVPPHCRRMWDRALPTLTNIMDDTGAGQSGGASIVHSGHGHHRHRDPRAEKYTVSVEPKLIAAKPETLLCDTCGGAIKGGDLRLGRTVRNAELRINTVIYYHFLKVGGSDCLIGHHVLPHGKAPLDGIKALPRKLRKVANARAEELRGRGGAGVGSHRLETPAEGFKKPVRSNFSRARKRRGRRGRSGSPSGGAGGEIQVLTESSSSTQLASTSASSDSGYSSTGSSTTRSDRGVGGIAVGPATILRTHTQGWASHTNPAPRPGGHVTTTPLENGDIQLAPLTGTGTGAVIGTPGAAALSPSAAAGDAEYYVDDFHSL